MGAVTIALCKMSSWNDNARNECDIDKIKSDTIDSVISVIESEEYEDISCLIEKIKELNSNKLAK